MALFSSCINDLEKVREPVDDEKKPTAITRNVKILYSDSGVVLTEVAAPLRLDYAGDDSYSEMPEGIKAIFYSNGRKSQTLLTAGYAMIRNKEDIMYVKKDVVIVNDVGEKLETQALTWDNKRKLLYTHELVKITKKDKMLYGEGMIANDNFSDYQILIPQGTLSINETE
jgi:LPS export ABC transporter protein LptC